MLTWARCPSRRLAARGDNRKPNRRPRRRTITCTFMEKSRRQLHDHIHPVRKKIPGQLQKRGLQTISTSPRRKHLKTDTRTFATLYARDRQPRSLAREARYGSDLSTRAPLPQMDVQHPHPPATALLRVVRAASLVRSMRCTADEGVASSEMGSRIVGSVHAGHGATAAAVSRQHPGDWQCLSPRALRRHSWSAPRLTSSCLPP